MKLIIWATPWRVWDMLKTAGAEFGIRPAGEDRFDIWIQGLAA